MKNKFLLTLLSLACVLCCAFAFAACEPGDNTTLTADQWSEIFTVLQDADNYTIDAGDNILKLDGAKLHVKMGVNEAIYAKEGNDYFCYMKEGANAGWQKINMPESQYTAALANPKSTLAQYSFLKDEFNSFTYADGKYIAESIDLGDPLGEIKDVTLTFKNNALVSVVFTAKENNQDVTYSLNAIGTTSVTLPEDYTEVGGNTPNGGGEVTETQWQEGLVAFATGKNFQLQLSVNGSTVGLVKMDGDKYYDNGGAERILVKDGSNYYRYDKYSANGNWSKSNSNAQEYNAIVNESAYTLVAGATQVLVQSYSSFTYNGGKYCAATLTVTEGFTLKNIEITFKNGAVSKIECTQVGTGGDPDTLTKIDAIGTTQVTLPNVGGGPSANTEVKEGEWEAALSMTAFTNFTASMTYSGFDTTLVLMADFSNKAYYYNTSDGKDVYYTHEGDKYYCYESGVKDAKLKRTEVTQSSYENQITYLEQMCALSFKGSYSSFTYDQKSKSYVAPKIEINGNLYKVDAKFENGKLVYINVEMGKEEYLTVNYVYGETDVSIPGDYIEVGGVESGVTCPIKQGQVLEVPVGTPVIMLYKEYPELETKDGKWELYMDMQGEWIKLYGSDEVPSEGKFNCKLVYEGKDKAEDVEFLLVGTVNEKEA